MYAFGPPPPSPSVRTYFMDVPLPQGKGTGGFPTLFPRCALFTPGSHFHQQLFVTWYTCPWTWSWWTSKPLSIFFWMNVPSGHIRVFRAEWCDSEVNLVTPFRFTFQCNQTIQTNFCLTMCKSEVPASRLRDINEFLHSLAHTQIPLAQTCK